MSSFPITEEEEVAMILLEFSQPQLITEEEKTARILQEFSQPQLFSALYQATHPFPLTETQAAIILQRYSQPQPTCSSIPQNDNSAGSRRRPWEGAQ